jgi:hypothetical protein
MHSFVRIASLLSAAVILSVFTISGAPSIGGYNVYYGDLHNHCNFDDAGHAAGTPDQAYNYARNTAGMDFLGLAPHDMYITSSEWDALGVAADAATVNGYFVGFRGFEWTTTPLGHIAIVNTGDYCTSTQTATNTFAEISSWIDARPGCVAFLNHPGRQDATGAEFDHLVIPPAANVVGMELWNKTDPFSVYYYNDGYTSNDNNKSYFDEAISRGWRIGASGAGDNHSGTWGTASPYRLAILANNLTRAELLAALQARRFFSTLDKNIALSFKINGSEMGSTIAGDIGQTLQVMAFDGDGEVFTEVTVFNRSHAIIATSTPNATNVNETFNLNTYDGDYFYVKVRQADGNEAISSPIMVSGGQANTPPACALTAPNGTETYIAPAKVYVAADASDAGSIAKVAFYVNSTFLGEDVTSPYEVTWNNAGAGTFAVTAVAYDDAGMMTTSAAVTITVTAAPGNYLVEKRISASSDDAEENTATGAVDATTSSDLELAYDSGLNRNQLVGVRFAGCAIPPNARISSAFIQFTCKETGSTSSNIAIKGEKSANPVTFSTANYNLSTRPKTTASVAWAIPAWATIGAATVGERTPDISPILQEIVNSASYAQSSALAFFFSGTGTRCAYSFGGSASGAALLHVEYNTLPPANTPPSCSITSPADGASYIGTSDVTVNAAAADAIGLVAQVEFMLNGLVVGLDASAPYSYIIEDLETGSYQLAVKATDDSGAVTTSTPVAITIREQNAPPVCNLVSPVSGASFTAPAGITISADASDADGVVTKVEFYANSAKIGEDATSPYSFSWTNVAAGAYSLTAVAIDNDAGAATSAPVSVTVNEPQPPVSIQQRIAIGTDDVEEYANGTMVRNHATLELVYLSRTTGNQVVGLRYAGLAIPQGATITSATLQFTAAVTKNGTSTVAIRGQKSVNAPAFSSGSKNVSNRTKTTATVSWAIPAWTNGNAGAAQKTPELKSIVQEIVNTGTVSSLVFIITGTGTKTGKAYEGSSAQAPLLSIQYTKP